MIEGGDLQIPAGALTISIGEDGQPTMAPVVPRLRTDMWPTWLDDMIDSAVESQHHHEGLGAAVAAEDEAEKARLLRAELRWSMRAITGAAFAFDSLYAALKARAGPHPHESTWRDNRTARHSQIQATLIHHLGTGTNAWGRDFGTFLSQVFRFRGAAVHPGSEYREPVYRPELDSGVDWHFAVFRAENAVVSATGTVSIFDALIHRSVSRSGEIADWRPNAQKAMAKVVEHYRTTSLPEIQLVSEQS